LAIALISARRSTNGSAAVQTRLVAGDDGAEHLVVLPDLREQRPIPGSRCVGSEVDALDAGPRAELRHPRGKDAVDRRAGGADAHEEDPSHSRFN
jgi:hypothetical protein